MVGTQEADGAIIIGGKAVLEAVTDGAGMAGPVETVMVGAGITVVMVGIAEGTGDLGRSSGGCFEIERASRFFANNE